MTNRHELCDEAISMIMNNVSSQSRRLSVEAEIKTEKRVDYRLLENDLFAIRGVNFTDSI